jgi:hypothetical protein
MFAGSAHAQMTTGAAMEGFSEAFDITAKGWSIQQTSCSLGANALWPGEEAAFTFFVQPGQPFKGAVKVDVIHYGTKGKPGDWWKPVVFKIADTSSTVVDVDLPAEGGFVTVKPPIGDTFGGYALIIDRGDRGRAFAATCVRVPAPEPGRVWLPTYAMDLGWPHEMSPVVFNVFQRLGVKGARTEGGYNTLRDAHVDWAMANDLTLLLTVGCGGTPREQMPLGRGRPWLRENGELIEGVKEDLAWLPSFDPEFKRYLKDVLIQHGWPKGPINAVELWNEPWEGVSISGWGADVLRYREIYQVMAEAVLEARQEAGVKVLIGGACSSANTRDKLFCDGTDTFLPWLDFVSIHYQPLAADPVLEPKWMHRQGDYGRVRVWDTESWVANSDDRVAAVIASMRAMGQDRTAGIYAGNVFTSQKPTIHGKEYAVAQVWAPGAAVAACQKFIGQRAFKEILFKNGLPWVFVFDGLPARVGGERTGPVNPDDGTVVIAGDLGASYDKNRTLFRSVVLTKNAQMEIEDGDGQFILHDFYGNPMPSKAGRIAVPLHELGYFLRTDGGPGSFQKLLAALAKGKLAGLDPVEIVACDPTAPISSQPKLRLKITNVLNRSVKGTLSVTLEGLTVEPAQQTVTLAGNETREVDFTITGGAADAANNYKLLATFDAGADGTKRHAEQMHVNVIARRSITVDGELDDWQGAIPQTSAQTVSANASEKAYLPFQNWDRQSSSGNVTAWLAHDDAFFYFAARVPRMEGLIRYETRDDDDFFYPEKVTSNGKELTWPAGVRRFSYRKDFDIPSGNGKHNVQIAFNVIPPEEKAYLQYPAGTMPRFSAYFDTDYEFALNQVGTAYGGGTEIFCLQRPGMMRKHFFPRQPKAPIDGGPVKGNAKLVVKDNQVECAIPWSELPEVKQRRDAGETIKFSFRVNQGDNAFELAAGRSVSKDNPLTFHNDWSTHWANELEFAFADAPPAQPIRVILDTDANNELDDQHAIAYLLFNGHVFDVEGITVNRTRAGGDIHQHYAEAVRVVQLCSLQDQVKVYRGADGSFADIQSQLAQPDFDGAEAVNFIIQQAKAADRRRLVLLPIGKLTNIALALAKDPSIASKIRVVWLGSNYPEPGEYNQVNDEPSLNYILDSGVDFEIALVRYGKPSGTDAVRATLPEIQRIMPGKGPRVSPAVKGRHGGDYHHFGDYAVSLFENIELHGNPPSRALFDMAAVAIVKNPAWATAVTLPAPILKDAQWIDRPDNPRRIILWENFDRPAILKDFYDAMTHVRLTGSSH